MQTIIAVFISLFCMTNSSLDFDQKRIPSTSNKCITQQEAEKILGQAAELEESTTEQKKDNFRYKCTFKATKNEPITDRAIRLNYMLEEYTNSDLAKATYTNIKKSNSRLSGLNTLDQIGDEAFCHSDGENFYLLMTRKGSKIVRMKVNKFTREASPVVLQNIVLEIMSSL